MKQFVLSDDTKVGNATWAQRREQGAMHPEYERKEWYKNLTDEDQKLIKMLRAAQDDQNDDFVPLEVSAMNKVSDEEAYCSCNDGDFLFVGCNKGVVIMYDLSNPM